MQFRPVVLSALVVGAALGLASCRSSQPEQVSLASGLVVKPLVTGTMKSPHSTDNYAQKQWRFQLSGVSVGKKLDARLELREKGQPVRDLGNVAYKPTTAEQSSPELLVSLSPVDNTWTTSKEITCLVRVTVGTGSSTRPNPFLNMNIASGEPKLQSDGSYLLMVANKDKSAIWPPAKTNDLSLVLTLGLDKGASK